MDDLEGEIWKDVVNYEGYFQISNMGRVKGVPRKFGRARILSPATNRYRYKVVCLCVNYVQKSALIHQLVMRAFIGETPEGLEINHKNGDKGDNRLENLEFCTPRENMLHSYRELGRKSVRGERNGMAIVNSKMVVKIREMYSTGKYSYRTLSNELNLNKQTVVSIVKRHTWKHIE